MKAALRNNITRFNWLTERPFLFPSSVSGRLIIAVTFGAFVFLFLRIFLPFGLAEIPSSKTVFISFYGISTFLVITLWLFLFPVIMPGYFDPGNFTIGRYIFLCFGNTLIIDTVNWAYTRIAGEGIIPPYNWWTFTCYTFVVGVFPVVFLTMVINKLIFKAQVRESIRNQQVSSNLVKSDVEERHIIINDNKVNEMIRIPETDFVCARSNENYTLIYYLEEGNLQRKMVRVPIARFFEQLKNSGTIVRCHRSCVVNLNYVKHVAGNSRSLTLVVHPLEEPVPVSRAFPRHILNHSSRGSAL